MIRFTVNNKRHMEYILLLSRTSSRYTEEFEKFFTNSKAINDSDFCDTYCREHGFVKSTLSVKSPCAWDKAFLFLFSNWDNFKNTDYFYFVEDDVFTTELSTISDLLQASTQYTHDLITFDLRSYKNDKHWYHWNQFRVVPGLVDMHRSFNPFCRLSRSLVEKIKDYHAKHNTLIFHEVMFATLVADNNLVGESWSKLDNLTKFFGTFHYRPVIDVNTITDNKIYHPVKNRLILQ